MAKLFSQLRKAALEFEAKPKAVVTKQTWTESLFLVRGKDEGRPAWHYILVPQEKRALFKSQPHGTDLDVTEYGRIIEYLDHRDKTRRMSGCGEYPPSQLEKWVDEHYGVAAADDNTALTYVEDDIRLCTMQRSTPDQKIGIYRCYHRQHRFHYIKLFDDLASSLAYRGGLRNFDRVISLNGVNTEQDTFEQLKRRFDSQRHLPCQMLVCSPATYEHYKSNNKSLHNDLPTVQRLKPVFNTLLSAASTNAPATPPANGDFCAVQWENSSSVLSRERNSAPPGLVVIALRTMWLALSGRGSRPSGGKNRDKTVNDSIVSVVPQSASFKSPEFTRVNDVCFIEVDGQYQKGKIIFKGSQSDCEIVKADLATHSHTCHPAAVHLTNRDRSSRLEHLPNELFLDLFDYFDIEHLYRSFWALNARFNDLLRSLQNLSLTFDEKNDPTLIALSAPQIVRLAIDTSNKCDLSQFSNLHLLTLHNRSPTHVTQIRAALLPNLVRLSFALESDFRPPGELVQEVFSNQFPSLRNVDLGHIDKWSAYTWSVSPRLQFVSIRCHGTMIVPSILASCPNLYHLQLHVSFMRRSIFECPSPSDHPLKRFTLWSNEIELTLDNIDTLLTYTPNVQQIYLQTKCRTPFVRLAEGVANRLRQLSRLDCYVKEMVSSDTRVGDLDSLHQIHPCFSRIQCLAERENFRIFAAE